MATSRVTSAAVVGTAGLLVQAAATIDPNAAASDRVGSRVSDLGWFVVFGAGATCGPEHEAAVVCSQSRSTTATCATHRRS